MRVPQRRSGSPARVGAAEDENPGDEDLAEIRSVLEVLETL